MSGQMNGRERVKRMFARQEQDRVPRHDTFWAETVERWQGEGLKGDDRTVLDLLSSDFQSLCFTWPSPFPGRREVLEEDEETILTTDQFGQTSRTWKHRAGTPEHVGWECKDRKIWDTRFREALLGTDLHVNIDHMRKRFAEGREKGRWCYFAGIEPFEMTRIMIGDETALMAMALEPEWIADVAEVTVDMVLRDYTAALDAGIEADGLWTYGDMAFRSATMCSPQMYRDLIFPQHKRLVEFAHSHGMPFIYHTDGDVNGVIDMYIEAGMDCLHPLESKASMDVRELAPKYGDQLAFLGNIDVMVMGTNDRDLIEAEIASKFAAGMSKRAYVYHSDHSVPPQVSWDTYQFIIELVERYGRYA